VIVMFRSLLKAVTDMILAVLRVVDGVYRLDGVACYPALF
jgi:hypothetical protein